jgi:hypothetical protein
VLLAGALFSAVAVAPYLRATLDPPPGTAFLGFFYYIDDHYNYLAHAEQAERGALVFTNKATLAEHRPALVNLEWWLVGRISKALGGRPRAAYRVFGIVAAFLFFLAVDRWLVRGGLPGSHRLAALALVGAGGGLGGALYALAERPIDRCLDLYAGLFPFLGLLANPHFTLGTALLLLGLLHFETAHGPGRVVGAGLLATALALVRPYDFVLLGTIRAASVLVLDPWRRWWAKLLPLATLLPAAAYLYWLFYRNPAFATYPGTVYPFPAALDLAWALGPAALAALVLRERPPPEARRFHVPLVAWLGAGLAVAAARPVPFSLQFLVGVGAPLLMLVAHGLARWRAGVTLAVAGLSATSAATVLYFMLGPNPRWYVPAARIQAAESLRGRCGPRDLFLAPAEIGQLAQAVAPCRAFVSHPFAPGHAERAREMEAFYLGRSPEQRAAFLDAQGITHLLLPGDAGEAPVGWLGPDTPFRRLALVGQGPSALAVYGRSPAAARPGGP